MTAGAVAAPVVVFFSGLILMEENFKMLSKKVIE